MGFDWRQSGDGHQYWLRLQVIGFVRDVDAFSICLLERHRLTA